MVIQNSEGDLLLPKDGTAYTSLEALFQDVGRQIDRNLETQQDITAVRLNMQPRGNTIDNGSLLPGVHTLDLKYEFLGQNPASYSITRKIAVTDDGHYVVHTDGV